jgi:hypothetical protein
MAGKRGLFFKDGGKTGVVFERWLVNGGYFLKMAGERGLFFTDGG